MPTGNTTLLGLALPVQGELDGTWGNVVNQQITELLDTAVAGTTTLNTDADVTLTTTVLAANQARQAVLLWTANGTTTRNITAPAQSKAYIVINASAGTQSIVVRGAGPTTGVTIIKGERALVAWNGSDFVKIGSTSGAGTFTDLTVTGNTILGDAAGDTITVNGATTFVNVSPTITPGTANGVAYLNGSKVLTTGSALTFDGGANLSTGGSNAATYNTFNVNNTASNGYSRLLFNIGASGANGIGSIKYAPGIFFAIGTDSDASSTPMTFNLNGSEQARLTSTGLGIGTSSPLSKLTVAANMASAGSEQLYITGTASTQQLRIGYNTTSNYGVIQAVQIGTAYRDLVINPDGGNLGIGTSSPAYKLDVQGGAGSSARVRSSSAYAALLLSSQDPNAGTRNWLVASNWNAYGDFALVQSNAQNGDPISSGTVRLNIDSSGNLGIGTSSPVSALGFGETPSSTGITFQSTNTTFNSGKAAVIKASITGSGNGSMVFETYAGGSGGGERMRLDSSGNLGIGTSSPGAKLQVSGATGTASSAYFENTASAIGSVINGLYFYSRGVANNWFSGIDAYVPAGSAGVDFTDLRFYTKSAERMRLDSSGNLGLGVTPSADWASSSYKAFVVRTSFLAGSTAPGVMVLGNNAYNDGASWKYVATGVASYYVQNAGAHSWSIAPSGTAGNAISFTQAMTLDASGNLGVGTTSPTERLQVANTGAASVYVKFQNNTVSSGFIGYNNGGALEFLTAGTERARITSGGDFWVGTTTAISPGGLTASNVLSSGTSSQWAAAIRNSTATTPWGLAIQYSGAAPNDTSSTFLYCVDSGPTLRASIRSNGGLANYSANNVNLSDRREKTNFAPAKDYLDTICAIPVQTFNYIDQSEDDPGLTLGVVAQDVQAVAPELVMESNWGTEDNPKMRLSIYQTDLQYALMKALQELKAEFDAYKATHP